VYGWPRHSGTGRTGIGQRVLSQRGLHSRHGRHQQATRRPPSHPRWCGAPPQGQLSGPLRCPGPLHICLGRQRVPTPPAPDWSIAGSCEAAARGAACLAASRIKTACGPSWPPIGPARDRVRQPGLLMTLTASGDLKNNPAHPHPPVAVGHSMSASAPSYGGRRCDESAARPTAVSRHRFGDGFRNPYRLPPAMPAKTGVDAVGRPAAPLTESPRRPATRQLSTRQQGTIFPDPGFEQDKQQHARGDRYAGASPRDSPAEAVAHSASTL